jgi:hypothetical protein
MPFARRYRRPLAAAAGVGCWLIAIAVASAQLDFRAGSLIDASPPAAAPLPSSLITQPPETLPSPLGSPLASDPLTTPSPAGWIAPPPINPDFQYHVGGRARGYYINDQRIEFTGMESTFAVEGVLEGGVMHRSGGWELSLETQLFLNQPFDKNVLADTPERRSFATNFDIDPLQISQLYLGARNGDCYFALGRFVTPFGRFYFPNYRNNFDDSPFIRSEAILFRETGVLLQWDPGIWVFNAALTNGGPQQDANSSKALVARAGIDQPWYALGTSVKWQDGNGSESQKAFNNHVGVDAMLRRGSWTLSGEAIYDQYGLRRPGTPLNNIHWGRSLYYRDVNNALHVPITGAGYYVNLGYEGPLWSLTLNYGDFFPEQIGTPQQTNKRRQNLANHRGLIKASRHWTPHFESYAVALLENDLQNAFDNSPRRGLYFIFGSQFTW